ncbi:MAG: hypothetical protein J6332_09035, partial [Abditibacteriota bacterium]|nr:hypothetical protein [Abditibacteriota bacterium]
DITRKSSGDPVKTIGMTNNMLSTNALVRAWGRILSASEGTMVINNGSGDVAVRIECEFTPRVGDFVTLTGIAAPTGIRAIEILN